MAGAKGVGRETGNPGGNAAQLRADWTCKQKAHSLVNLLPIHAKFTIVLPGLGKCMRVHRQARTIAQP